MMYFLGITKAGSQSARCAAGIQKSQCLPKVDSKKTCSAGQNTRVAFTKSYLSSGSFSSEKEPEPEPPGHLKDLALHAMSCYAYDEESRTASVHGLKDPKLWQLWYIPCYG